MTNFKLEQIAYLTLLLENIETRWCPFKSAETYYRNKQNNYYPPTSDYLYEIGKILHNQEKIICNNCPKLINEENIFTENIEPSILQPLFDWCTEGM